MRPTMETISQSVLTSLSNFIGPVDQENVILGDVPEDSHVNNFEASQIAAGQNDCDETGAGDNFADCANFDESSNVIESVTQVQLVFDADSAAQINDASSDQTLDLANDCDESGDGDNNPDDCDIEDVDNLVGPLNQDNGIDDGGPLADISQSNQIDGSDVDGIPGITQTIVGSNDCDEEGPGDNFALCNIFSTDNDIDGITQENDINGADDLTVISQDNGAVISQAINLRNDCDESSTTSEDNTAECLMDSGLDNFIEDVDQLNTADAEALGVIDQDNNVALSQDLFAVNDCDGTDGNDALCTNDGDDDVNVIRDIDQSNDASVTGNAISAQFNEVAADQNAALFNFCSEIDNGINQASCNNVVLNTLGPIDQSSSNEAGDAVGATIAQSNVAQLAQNMLAVNDCDEAGAGDSAASCQNSAENIIEEFQGSPAITQSNNAPDVGDDYVQNNLVAISQDLQARNDCDELGDGDNGDGGLTQSCGNAVANIIGPVDQSNDAEGGQVADISQNNDITSMNQVLLANNDCDQSGPGDNLAQCANSAANFIDDVTGITQENDASGDEFTDILQDNNAAFSQVVDLNNNCDESTNLLLEIT